MTTNNFEESMSEFEKGQEREDLYFKFPVGNTKIRVLSDFTASHSLFEGEYPNGKFVRKLDRYENPKDGFKVKTSWNAWALVGDQLKVIQFPYSLMKQFKALTDDPEWGFRGFPMSHDVTIGNTGDGGARYSLIGSPKRSDVPADVMASLEKRTAKSKHASSPAMTADNYPDEIDPKDIPF